MKQNNKKFYENTMYITRELANKSVANSTNYVMLEIAAATISNTIIREQR